MLERLQENIFGIITLAAWLGLDFNSKEPIRMYGSGKLRVIRMVVVTTSTYVNTMIMCCYKLMIYFSSLTELKEFFRRIQVSVLYQTRSLLDLHQSIWVEICVKLP